MRLGLRSVAQPLALSAAFYRPVCGSCICMLLLTFLGTALGASTPVYSVLLSPSVDSAFEAHCRDAGGSQCVIHVSGFHPVNHKLRLVLDVSPSCVHWSTAVK